jgi:hypothetical protein
VFLFLLLSFFVSIKIVENTSTDVEFTFSISLKNKDIKKRRKIFFNIQKKGRIQMIVMI